jgi:hypothetical protein
MLQVGVSNSDKARRTGRCLCQQSQREIAENTAPVVANHRSGEKATDFTRITASARSQDQNTSYCSTSMPCFRAANSGPLLSLT